ncbi:MAG: DUF1643 domain-containing protein [Bacteroidota bacterium]
MTEIYHTDEANNLRFLLGRYHASPLIIMGVNPSTATPTKDDMTSKKVATFAEKLGFDGWVLCNLYPKRATFIKDLPHRRSLAVHHENLLSLRRLLTQLPSPTIWAAWGNLIASRPYLRVCLKDIIRELNPFQPTWVHLGSRTLSGHPRHPSRMGYKEVPTPFLVEEYVQELFEMSEKS